MEKVEILSEMHTCTISWLTKSLQGFSSIDRQFGVDYCSEVKIHNYHKLENMDNSCWQFAFYNTNVRILRLKESTPKNMRHCETPWLMVGGDCHTLLQFWTAKAVVTCHQVQLMRNWRDRRETRPEACRKVRHILSQREDCDSEHNNEEERAKTEW